MSEDAKLLYADHVGRFYAQEYGFAPMTGRLLGYLTVCEPEQQSINELADALLASRSAVTGAVKALEGGRLVRRTRVAGERVDRVSLDAAGLENNGFNPTPYLTQAKFAREALDLLPATDHERRQVLEDVAGFCEFLSRRMPEILTEWHRHRDELRTARGDHQ